MKKILTFMFCLTIYCVYADAKLADIFANHMVLQRDAEVPVFGTAAPGEKISVSFNGQTVSATADAKGKWIAVLSPMPANKNGQRLTVKGSKNSTYIANVLIGDVWLCGGQSNMEMPMLSSWWSATGAKEDIIKGRTNNIRYIKVPHKNSFVPFEGKINMRWVIANNNNANPFSATAFYFGQELLKSLDVPIGLVVSCWSGSRIEPWITSDGFASVPQLKNDAALNAELPGTPEYDKTNKNIVNLYEKWLADFKKAVQNQQVVPNLPAYPVKVKINPSVRYNGMIHPLIPFKFKGTIWYQGCSNLSDGEKYQFKMQALVNTWRKSFNDANMPFYIVQLAPYRYRDPYALPLIWETQQKFAESAQNVKMAVINDVGDMRDIHPRNKKDVGKRLALLALKYTYGKSELKADSPALAKYEFKNDKIILSFKNVEKWNNTGKDNNFEISSDNKKWIRAKFEINGKNIIVYADSVRNPVALRYMWHQQPQGNLWNEAGLPLGAFRCNK